MEYEIEAGSMDKIDFSAKGRAQVLQNLRTLFCTARFSVPLDRALGMDTSIVDAPVPRAMGLMTNEIVEVVRKYEPRARVLKVSWDGDSGGVLTPKVTVDIDV